MDIMSFCLILTGLFSTNVFAKGNTKNTGYYLEFPKGYQINRYTGNRLKKNDSSVYQKNSWIGNKKTMRMWVVTSDKKDVSGGHYILVKSGQKKYIPNIAYERHGKSKIRLAAEIKRGNIVRIGAKGVWSPDSK
jgi:hypothetical protein